MIEQEQFHKPEARGTIEVICGSMFSGKSEELIRRVRRAMIAGQYVQVFKPRIDNRYSNELVVSHDGNEIQAIIIDSAQDILNCVDENAQVVAIDEGHFIDSGLVEVCEQIAQDGKRVIVAGLDQDYRGKPFEPMPQLMALAEYVTKTLAVCVKCGAPANKSQRLIENKERILVGVHEYEARCRHCFCAPDPNKIGKNTPKLD